MLRFTLIISRAFFPPHSQKRERTVNASNESERTPEKKISYPTTKPPASFTRGYRRRWSDLLFFLHPNETENLLLLINGPRPACRHPLEGCRRGRILLPLYLKLTHPLTYFCPLVLRSQGGENSPKNGRPDRPGRSCFFSRKKEALGERWYFFLRCCCLASQLL